MSLHQVSIRGVLARPVYKISIRGLLARSLSLKEACWQDLKRSPCNVSVQDLIDLCMKPLSRLSRRGLLARPPGQDLYGGADFVRAWPSRNACQHVTRVTRAYKSHFIRFFSWKMPQPSTYRATLCASLRKRNARQHFTGAALYGNWQKNHATAQIEPRTRTHTLCVNISQEPLYTQILLGKMPRPRLRPERGHTLCASLRSQNARQHFTRATLYGNLQEKLPRPRLSPERGHTLCASSRSRNARQHFTRATWYRNLKEKCRRPDWHTHTHAPRRRHFVKKRSSPEENPARNFHQTRKKVRKQKNTPKTVRVLGEGFFGGKRKRYQTIPDPRIWGKPENLQQTNPIWFFVGNTTLSPDDGADGL